MKCLRCGFDNNELSRREAEAEALLLTRPDLGTKGIAAEMDITASTASAYIGRVFRKRGVRDRLELMHNFGRTASVTTPFVEVDDWI